MDRRTEYFADTLEAFQQNLGDWKDRRLDQLAAMIANAKQRQADNREMLANPSLESVRPKGMPYDEAYEAFTGEMLLDMTRNPRARALLGKSKIAQGAASVTADLLNAGMLGADIADGPAPISGAMVGFAKSGKALLPEGMEHLAPHVLRKEQPIVRVATQGEIDKDARRMDAYRRTYKRTGIHNKSDVMNDPLDDNRGTIITQVDNKPEHIRPFTSEQDGPELRGAIADMNAPLGRGDDKYKVMRQKLPKGSVVLPLYKKVPNAHAHAIMSEAIDRFGLGPGTGEQMANALMHKIESQGGVNISGLRDVLQQSLTRSDAPEGLKRFNKAFGQALARSEVDAVALPSGNFWVTNTEAIYNPRGRRLAGADEVLELRKVEENRTLIQSAPSSEFVSPHEPLNTNVPGVSVGGRDVYSSRAANRPASIVATANQENLQDFDTWALRNDLMWGMDDDFSDIFITRNGDELTYEQAFERYTGDLGIAPTQGPSFRSGTSPEDKRNLPQSTYYNMVDRRTGKSIGWAGAEHTSYYGPDPNRKDMLKIDVAGPGTDKKTKGAALRLPKQIGMDYPPGAYAEIISERVSGAIRARHTKDVLGLEKTPSNEQVQDMITNPNKYGITPQQRGEISRRVSMSVEDRTIPMKPGGRFSHRPFKEQNKRLEALGLLLPPQ